MAAQFAGAFGGALLMAFFSWATQAIYPIANAEIFAAMWQETFGTMVFVIFFKLCTDETLYFSKEQAINCLIIAASYIASRDFFGGGFINHSATPIYGVTNYGACLNPAIALGIVLTSLFFEPGQALKWVWLYPVLPFAGAILAVIFYELVYKKTQLMLNAHSEEAEFEENEKLQHESSGMEGGVLDD